MLNGKTPYEMLHGHQPTYNHLGIFGSLCYAHNQGRKSDKLASRSRNCVFVGYPYGKKGWKLFDLERKEFFVSRDVEFVEATFPFAESSFNYREHHDNRIVGNFEDFVEDVYTGAADHGESSVDDRGSETNVEIDAPASTIPNETTEANSRSIVPSDAPLLGRGHRSKQSSSRLCDFMTNTIKRLSPSSCSSSPKANSGELYPITNYVNCDNFYLAHRVFLASISQEKEPISYTEAV